MTSMFAEISYNIINHTTRTNRRSGYNSATFTAEHPDAANLLKRLRDEVERGWWFTHAAGLDAMSAENITDPDFIDKYDGIVRLAAGRIDWWREFLDDYLQYINTEILVVMVDDSDSSPKLTDDILHSIRMYLNHPRVVTILAGNTRAMRSTLIHPAMVQLGDAMQALSSREGMTANDWRRGARKSSEDYLDKIIPTSNRFYLKPSMVQGDLETTEGNNILDHKDFRHITGTGLVQVAEEIMGELRPSFLVAKYRLAVRHMLNISDAPNAFEKGVLENFLSWWNFAYRYSNTLAPQSPRQIATFRDYFLGDSAINVSGDTGCGTARAAISVPQPRTKRLTIALFESPSNYALLQQFNDHDPNVTTWLQNQVVSSRWVGQRLFRINGRDISHSTYSYEYLQFRLDVGVSMPIRYNSEEVLPPGLLPILKGRRYMRRFFQPQRMPRRQRRLGISRWIDHSVVPGNCLYFRDVQAIPNMSLIGDRDAISAHGEWEEWLSHNWVEVVEDGQNEYLYRYFTEVACAGLRGTGSIESSELLRLLDPPAIARQQDEALFEFFLADELAGFEQPAAEIDWTTDLSRADPRTQAELRRQRRRSALYSALVTDVRRAWHAIRIFESSPSPTMRSASSGSGVPTAHNADEIASFAVIATHDRLRLYTIDQIDDILRNTHWTRNMYDTFSSENIVRTIENVRANTTDQGSQRILEEFLTFSNLQQADVGRVYSATGPIPTLGMARPIFDEYQEFKIWTRTLRAIGRLSSDEWPDYGDTEPANNWPSPESRAGFQRIVRSLEGAEKILFRDVDRYQKYHLNILGNVDADQYANQRQNSRSARNFVWLIYGLAPSLPAVIHVSIMGRLYNAILNQQGLMGSTAAVGSAVTRKEIANQIDDAYRQSSLEIERWSNLVGSTAAILRYVRVKYIHLHVGFALNAIYSCEVSSLMRELLNSCGIPDRLHAQVQERLRTLFSADKGLEKGLLLLPDAASSTLFGDKWLIDTILSVKNFGLLEAGADSGEPDDLFSRPINAISEGSRPMEVSGVFAETEQWLWAASRALSKLRVALDKKRDEWEDVKNDMQNPKI